MGDSEIQHTSEREFTSVTLAANELNTFITSHGISRICPAWHVKLFFLLYIPFVLYFAFWKNKSYWCECVDFIINPRQSRLQNTLPSMTMIIFVDFFAVCSFLMLVISLPPCSYPLLNRLSHCRWPTRIEQPADGQSRYICNCGWC